MVVQCCVCKKVRRQSGEWVHAVLPARAVWETSHGFCPRCVEVSFADIRRRRQAQRQVAASGA